jgi:hypothetical protein
MTDFYNPQYDLEEAAARRRRETRRRGYEFDVSSLGRRGQEAQMEINRQFAQGMEPRVTSFSRRGLGRSGLFRRAMSDYAAEQQRQLAAQTRGLSEQLGQLSLQDLEASTELQDALDALRLRKAREIQSSASQLKSWAPFTGLYS